MTEFVPELRMFVPVVPPVFVRDRRYLVKLSPSMGSDESGFAAVAMIVVYAPFDVVANIRTLAARSAHRRR